MKACIKNIVVCRGEAIELNKKPLQSRGYLFFLILLAAVKHIFNKLRSLFGQFRVFGEGAH